MDYIVDFDGIDWVVPEWAAGGTTYKEKRFVGDNRRMRMVEFKEGFHSPGFCNNGHSGIVLKGQFHIDMNGTTVLCKEGETFNYPAGDQYKHKVHMEKGDGALVLFFEVEEEKI
jgi:quercetin dioxygenase-like cupin family protein